MELNGVVAAAVLLVRVHNNYGVPVEDLQIAQQQAEAILQDAGVRVEWIACWHDNSEPPDASPRCRQPLQPDDVVVRLHTAGTTPGTAYTSMGFSLVTNDTSMGPPALSTVYPDRVSSMARRAGIDARVLLGRAIAHEIGHLLLNSPRHADQGLMREVWSQAELHRAASGPAWAFLQSEAALLRRAAARRTARTLDRRGE